MEDRIIQPEEKILVTGAAGFIGSRVVECLLQYGYRNICCLVRPTSKTERLEAIRQSTFEQNDIEIVKGNLLSPDDCLRVSAGCEVNLSFGSGAGREIDSGRISKYGCQHEEPSRSRPSTRNSQAICECQFFLGLFEPRESSEGNSRRILSDGE